MPRVEGYRTGRLENIIGKHMSELNFGLEERILNSKDELAQREALLTSRGLMVPEGEELVLGLFVGEQLVATGALVRNVLQGIAVDIDYEGEGISAAIVSSLIRRAVDRGITQVFLYTISEDISRFESLGFRKVAAVPRGAALLEWGTAGIESYLASIRALAKDKPDHAGAVVINCNPFTLGHRYLIEHASSHVPWLYVLVVEEDRSLFPFKVRYKLVQEGVADLRNVTVMKGGPYIISSATFPTYFIRPDVNKASWKAVRMHASLDVSIFRTHIAPALKVTDRFVGTEPYCPTTSIYNDIMKIILQAKETEAFGLDAKTPPVALHEIPRFELWGTPVSASKVRDMIREGNLSEVQKFVPETTWDWLKSEEAAPVIERIRQSDSRH